MKCYKRIIAFFLAFAMSVSMLSFASAAEPAGVLEDSASVAAWNTYIAGNLKDGASASSAQTVFWRNRDQVLSNAGIGKLESYAQLTKATTALNRSAGGLIQQLADLIADAVSSLFSSPDYIVMYDGSFGCFRPYDNRTGLWVVNSMGHFPYYPVESFDGSTDNTDPTKQLTYQWIRGSQVNWDGGKAIVSYTELKDILGLGYDGYLKQRNQYLHIYDSTGTQILCTEEGYPLSAIADMQSTAVGTPNNYYTDEGDTVNNITNIDQGDTTNNQFIDITDNSVWFPDGTLQYIDNLYYDESTKTYYVDSHDSYTYNTETNTYITNNYRYEYNYYIDYTSVTYIGQTEEYDEEYRYYYQLPDGRSSADLTAEDLEQLSLVFDDVIQYSRTADNIDQRALYHFDGNTEDSSYWSYCSDFDWSSGASLTYMDEGTFNGSLYLDETEHDFIITLPNNDAAGDWTLQFRYYQSYTAAPVTDSYLKVGNHVVLQFTGAQYLYASGSVLAATSIGTWNEICLIRSNGVLYYYINGVYLGSAADVVYHNKTINFHFGSEQQTYKKLDELRFTSAVIYSPGKDYTPSAVPFDSNLTLVLPDNGTLEEQGLQLVPSENNLLTSVGLDDWTSLDVVENLYGNIDFIKYCGDSSGVTGYEQPSLESPIVVYNPDVVTFQQSNNAVTVNLGGSSGWDNAYWSDGYRNSYPYNCLFVPIAYLNEDDRTIAEADLGSFGYKPNTYYTLSVVFSDGSYCYYSFYIDPNGIDFSSVPIVSAFTSSNVSGGGYLLGRRLVSDSSSALPNYFGLAFISESSFDVVYMELVEGTQPEFQFTKTYSTFVEDPEPVEVIPDEFTTITKPVVSSNLLESKNLDDWTSLDVVDYLSSDISAFKGLQSAPVLPSTSDGYQLLYDPDVVSFSETGKSVSVNFGGNEAIYEAPISTVDATVARPKNSLFFPVCNTKNYTYSVITDNFGFSYDAAYTFSVVLSDGSSSSMTFTIPSTSKESYYGNTAPRVRDITFSSDINSAVLLDFALCGCTSSSSAELNDTFSTYNRTYGVTISLAEGSTAEILYMELVKDSAPHFSAGRQTSIYTAADLVGAPILAVRTNQTITGYQFGGVRPSYPTKGQIWAMVENSRIRSLQQYTGSAWVEVDGRIWTGERWIPYSSYDVFLLKDCYDILGTVSDPDYEYIYSESGFWAWWQKQWLSFKDGLFGKLDAIIAALEELTGLEISDETGCQHVYTMETYDATCSDPGHTIYTCTECEHTFTESIDALGHDWIMEEDVPNTYKMPDGAYCPGCTGTDFTFVINASQDEYTCTCTTCSTEWMETPEVTYGYTLSTCSRCGKIQKDSKDPESGIFDALGNFLADGVEWVTDKLTQAVNGLNDMLMVFQEYAESMKEKVGEYPAFLTAVIAVMPQDLMDVFWFGLVALLVVIAWKKLSS